MKVTLQLK